MPACLMCSTASTVAGFDGFRHRVIGPMPLSLLLIVIGAILIILGVVPIVGYILVVIGLIILVYSLISGKGR